VKKSVSPPAPMAANARIYSIVANIPCCKIATYGQIAALAGLPRQARKVGRALHALPVESDVPWQRVINAKGRGQPAEVVGSSPAAAPSPGRKESSLTSNGRVNFKRFRWRPSRQSAKTTTSTKRRRVRGARLTADSRLMTGQLRMLPEETNHFLRRIRAFRIGE
jgi:methylated-DNA-protein-cysteine methyltransferase related protein